MGQISVLRKILKTGVIPMIRLSYENGGLLLDVQNGP